MATSTPKKVGIKGKIIHSQAREIIANVLEFMKTEAENGTPSIPLAHFRERLIAATKISKKTYQSIVTEKKNIESGASTSFSSPRKKRPRVSCKSSLPCTEIEIIRNIIHNFYLTEKRRPTLKGIHEKMKECGVPFEGSLSTLRTVIMNIGFKWKKTADKREQLMETQEVQYKRNSFLRQLSQYKKEGKQIVYTDESYIHSSHTQSKEWSDSSLQGLRKPIGKGPRLIMVHAGGSSGFVPNALLMFRSGLKSGDYHDDMNAANFLTWVKTQLLPNLNQPSVLVIDNASYHNTTLEKHPTSATLKKDMITWLAERNIPYEAHFTKPELYNLIKIHKPAHKKYELDTLLVEHGHRVLRLPPYHPELNPIEKIWAIVKNWVAARNVTFKLQDVQALAEEKFAAITKEEWESVCRSSDEVAVQYMEKAHMLDEAIEAISFTVNTGESDDESDYDSESDSNDIY